MHNAKDESSETIKIMQEHNWVMNFLNNRVKVVKKVSASSDPNEYQQAKDELNEFVHNLREHFNRAICIFVL